MRTFATLGLAAALTVTTTMAGAETLRWRARATP